MTDSSTAGNVVAGSAGFEPAPDYDVLPCAVMK